MSDCNRCSYKIKIYGYKLHARDGIKYSKLLRKTKCKCFNNVNNSLPSRHINLLFAKPSTRAGWGKMSDLQYRIDKIDTEIYY